MKNFIYSGESLTFTHIGDVPLKPGQGHILADIFGVVSTQLRPDQETGALSPLLKKGQSGELFIVGVFSLLKDESSADVGQAVYWDDTNKRVTATAKNNRLIGVCAESVDKGSHEIKVRLLGFPILAPAHFE